MEMLLLALSCLFGYLASEWPRLLWPGNKRMIVSRAEMRDPVKRRLSVLLPILGFVAVIPALMFAIGRVSPETARELGLGLVALVIFCVMGAAIGLLELISGLSPASDWMHDINRFHGDVARSRRIGAWRLGTCVVVYALLCAA